MAYPKQMGYPMPCVMPTSLFQAIEMMASPEVVENFLSSHPTAVQERGFNNQTPFHRAVMCASYEVNEVLLKYGADPNARNQHNETPLLMACRSLHPQILHLLLQHGADITAVDHNGHGCLVQALHSGAMYLILYMVTEKNLPLQVTDMYGMGPLHIACSHGHVDTIVFLLRRKIDVFAQDSLGNTALHVAASKGFARCCWILMEQGGQALLDVRNRDGSTALDVAAKGTLHIHETVAQLLRQYSQPGRDATGIHGPVMLWYWYVALPALLYSLGLILGQALPWKGWLMTACLATVVVVTNRQWHRIQHICSWPNPMSAGMFASGLVFTSLCFLLVELPLLYESRPILSVSCVCGIILMFYTYYRLMVTDPGCVKQPYKDEKTGQPLTIQDVAARRLPVDHFCTACELSTPPRTKHCKLCQSCYIDMDHHCLFMYLCIAYNNHRLFVRFIALVSIAMAFFLGLSVLCISNLYPGRPLDFTLVSVVFREQPMIWSLTIMNALSMFWLCNQLRFQLIVVSKGQTQYFQTKMHSNLSLFARVMNVINFLLGRKFYAVESRQNALRL